MTTIVTKAGKGSPLTHDEMDANLNNLNNDKLEDGDVQASANITGGTIAGITDLAVADGGTGASDAAGARTNLGLGTISTQDANNVNIDGGAIDSTPIGATTPSTGAFTTLSATGNVTLGDASTDTVTVAGSIGVGTTNAQAAVAINRTLPGSAGFSQGIRSTPTIDPSVSTAAAYTYHSLPSVSAGTLPDLRHYNAQTPSLTGTVTNQYGFYSSLASGTGQWNLYCAGTANNYMAGSLGIGSTSISSLGLRISKSMTGAVTSYGALVDPSVLSDVATALYFTSTSSTQAATFSTAIHGYFASQGIIGNGSIVSAQYGFNAGPLLTGGTTNFGFYSNIAAPTAGGTSGAATSVSQSGTTVTVTTPSNTLVTGQTVTIALTANATALVSGVPCTILTAGTTDFTLIGAANNNVGTSFVATGAGTGTGTVTINSQGSGKSITVNSATEFTYTATSATFASVTLLTGTITVSTRYNLYCNGTALNYMNGNLGIGIVPTTAIGLYLSKALASSSNNTFGGYFNISGDSSATSGIYGVYGAATTAAASYTCSNLYAFFTANPALGASSSVTNRYGLYVNEVSGATNNYGIRSLVTAGSGKWNIYADGTARNYFAGGVEVVSGTTGMTSGFTHCPAAAGAPTGAPTNPTGNVPLYYDTTNNRLYVYSGGTWRSVVLA